MEARAYSDRLFQIVREDSPTRNQMREKTLLADGIVSEIGLAV